MEVYTKAKASVIAHSCKDGVNSGNLIQEIRLPVIYRYIYIYFFFYLFFFHDDKLGFGGPKRKSRMYMYCQDGFTFFLAFCMYRILHCMYSSLNFHTE